ncbi:MAG: sigma-54-dependent Fis family transcriptional regulator [Chitinophagaceae bacterium]|jgi:DNA-binding NtrC family response regulator|nr:MAG: sigma-54-dependent Fis family transcriptional regulator [Chitinophagaceae bacterium]
MQLKQAKILVIDDDRDLLTAVRLLLKTEVAEVVTESNPENIRTWLSKNNFHIILLDMNFISAVNTGNEGLFWLKKIKDLKPDASVIMITAYGDIDLAVRSLKEGANDFIVKPWNNEKLITTFKEVLRKKSSGGNMAEAVPDNDIIGSELLGESQMMQDIFYKIKKIGPTDANILILGENGTGKDLIAKAIHDYSLRSKNPFIKVDVGALTESLFESELFGYKKGAFTDAAEDRTGRFEAANGGTLFLDEIGNISLYQQSKLLTVLQNRQVNRLGSHENIPVNIRLVCATNIPLSELSNEQRFRKDLIYRINTIEITAPPLREREGDTALLAKHFVKKYADKYLKPGITISDAALKKLSQYHFPGNVRELQYIIERATIMSEENEISAEDIIFSPIESAPQKGTDMKETNLNIIERNTILNVIEKNNGNISRAAKELGLTRTALYRRLNKYDI